MRILCHAVPKTASAAGGLESVIRGLFERIAAGTDTSDLIVSVYLLPGIHATRGTAYVRHWVTPKEFRTGRGHWGITKRFPAPGCLPERFKLIRMRIDPDPSSFPRTERDGYHWIFQYRTFDDQIAMLFAHELHHFRRYHLGLHPREGEHSSNRWALDTVLRMGFCVEGRPVLRPRKTQHFFPRLRRWLDLYGHLRGLKEGARILITHDPDGQYAGQVTRLVRPVRLNAKRVVIQTPDGKTWRWPMAWVKKAG
jgi:hypothetical protein